IIQRSLSVVRVSTRPKRSSFMPLRRTSLIFLRMEAWTRSRWCLRSRTSRTREKFSRSPAVACDDASGVPRAARKRVGLGRGEEDPVPPRRPVPFRIEGEDPNAAGRKSQGAHHHVPSPASVLLPRVGQERFPRAAARGVDIGSHKPAGAARQSGNTGPARDSALYGLGSNHMKKQILFLVLGTMLGLPLFALVRPRSADGPVLAPEPQLQTAGKQDLLVG